MPTQPSQNDTHPNLLRRLKATGWRGIHATGVTLDAALTWSEDCWLAISTDTDDGQISVSIWHPRTNTRRVAFWMPREAAERLRDELTEELAE